MKRTFVLFGVVITLLAALSFDARSESGFVSYPSSTAVVGVLTGNGSGLTGVVASETDPVYAAAASGLAVKAATQTFTGSNTFSNAGNSYIGGLSEVIHAAPITNSYQFAPLAGFSLRNSVDTKQGMSAYFNDGFPAALIQAGSDCVGALCNPSYYPILLQPSGGNIGVGTVAPAYKLDVTGGGHFTSSVTADGGFYGNGSNLVSITAAQVGAINKTGDLGMSGNFRINDSNKSFDMKGDGNQITISSQGWTNVSLHTSNDSGRLRLNASGSLKTQISAVANEASYFNNGGNVGIGNAGGSDRLNVTGNIRASGSIVALSSITAGGNGYYGDGTNLTGVIHSLSGYAATAATQTFTGSNTFSNTGNVYFGDGSNLSGITSGVATTSSPTWTGQHTFAKRIEFSIPGSNTFVGTSAGQANTTGGSNTFVGTSAGYANTTGGNNAFFGRNTGDANTEGNSNSFFGQNAGGSNIVGGQNTFIGQAAGKLNTASNNTFVGSVAGESNTTGASNTFVGQNTGNSNTTGASNTFVGFEAGNQNTEGYSNAFFGQNSGWNNTTGVENTLIGFDAGGNITTGNKNIMIGKSARPVSATANDQLNIGDAIYGTMTAVSTITFVGGIYATMGVSAQNFIDRTPYPDTVAAAYKAVNSIKRAAKGGVDHAALDGFVKAAYTNTRLSGYKKVKRPVKKLKNGKQVTEQVIVDEAVYVTEKGEGRNLSATVSAQNEVIKDLIQRIAALEKTK